MDVSPRHFRQKAVRWIAVVVGLAAVAVMSTAYLPGPWHDDNETGTQECQCPVCKVIGHGALASNGIAYATPPASIVGSISLDPVSHDIKTIVRDHSARAPPA